MEKTILDKAIEDAGRVCRLACRMAEAETSVDWCDSMVESDGVLLIYEVVELFCCAVTRIGREQVDVMVQVEFGLGFAF